MKRIPKKIDENLWSQMRDKILFRDNLLSFGFRRSRNELKLIYQIYPFTPKFSHNDAINCLLQNSTHRTHPSVFLHPTTVHPKWRLMKLMMMEMWRRKKTRKIRTNSRIVHTNVNFAKNPFLAWATWRSMSR
jgi:hypothetical protein